MPHHLYVQYCSCLQHLGVVPKLVEFLQAVHDVNVSKLEGVAPLEVERPANVFAHPLQLFIYQKSRERWKKSEIREQNKGSNQMSQQQWSGSECEGPPTRRHRKINHDANAIPTPIQTSKIRPHQETEMKHSAEANKRNAVTDGRDVGRSA